MKEQLTINFGKYLFGPKTPFHWKKCFSWRLGQFFRCFEWKYRAVSENVFSLSVIYLHFSHCKFSFFWWIDWVRFKTRLAKGPILELADWTGLVCKFSEFDIFKCAFVHFFFNIFLIQFRRCISNFFFWKTYLETFLIGRHQPTVVTWQTVGLLSEVHSTKKFNWVLL